MYTDAEDMGQVVNVIAIDKHRYCIIPRAMWKKYTTR